MIELSIQSSVTETWRTSHNEQQKLQPKLESVNFQVLKTSIKANLERWTGRELRENSNAVTNWTLSNNIRVVLTLICKNISLWNSVSRGWNAKMASYQSHQKFKIKDDSRAERRWSQYFLNVLLDEQA